MNCQAMPTLKQLALKGLLSDEDMVISALEDLPTMLFPPVFKEAFINDQTKIVKAMVVNWPFPCLPLGALIDYFYWDNFQAVLDGIDWLSSQSVRPRRCRLQVLNLQDAHHDFWGVQVGTQACSCSSDTDPGETTSTTAWKQQLKV
ncbi:PRAME family member 22-like, partial [Psammomys obesus]|uniref:PRAME family member 22-like n=1 Tax=Psammomys obesus TaxID=48139 RepID=UPI0024532445